jgi:glyoxylase-like metal-dependent hydrolase (beta-lactamase superfamily II)
LLSAWKEGEAAQLLFPNATFIASAAHVARARDPHSRDRASFIPELLPLLEASGRFEVVDGPYSQALGHAVRFHFSEGHTPGLMLAEIVGKGGHGGVVFCADLIPGRAWVHLPVTMGYDRYPERLIDEKLDFLADKLERDVRLFFTHDTECAMARVRRDDKGRYSTSDELPELRGEPLPA